MINNTSLNTSIRTAIKNDLRLNYQTRIWLDVISAPATELKEKIEKAKRQENGSIVVNVKRKCQKTLI